jgi:hypothetical protein
MKRHREEEVEEISDLLTNELNNQLKDPNETEKFKKIKVSKEDQKDQRLMTIIKTYKNEYFNLIDLLHIII